jgi:HSP20 family protein
MYKEHAERDMNPWTRRLQMSMYHHLHHMKGGGYRRPKYNVPINISEQEDSFTVYVYATAFEKENIKISVSDDVLYVRGTKAVDESTVPKFVLQEFPVRTFEREVQLRGQVDVQSISAKHENGVLLITLPKLAAASPRVEIGIS